MKYFIRKLSFLLLPVMFGLGACQASKNRSLPNQDAGHPAASFVDKTLEQAMQQFARLAQEAMRAQRIPRTVSRENTVHWTKESYDWTEGFFPGTSWYFYEVTQNDKWKAIAEAFQAQYEDHKFNKTSHDLGFIFNCSYGNGYRLTGNEAFKQVMIAAGNTLITRFDPVVGSLQSWNVDKGWQATRGWRFPVIIDNMMNLELLFELTELSGDPTYREVAIRHANTTLKNHFRPDNSSWHVVDYDPETGAVRGKHTAQGYADTSAWARGQAWGLYGFVVCYRYTQNPVYLRQAVKIADFIIAHDRVAADKIPYWDYDAPDIPHAPRDASAAAITASALLELSDYTDQEYGNYAHTLLESLSSAAYLAEPGTNHHFILKHSVGSIPHDNEIDVPLNYADYYFIEALLRLKNKRATVGSITPRQPGAPLQNLFRDHETARIENVSSYWRNYLRSRQEDTDLYQVDSPVDPRFIPNNFSYAGYHRSDEPLPTKKDLSSYRPFNVIDFGAIPNDGKSDQPAIRRALSALTEYQKKAGKGAILFFPEGKFIINDETDMARIDPHREEDLRTKQVIQLMASRFVLRGAGADKTILWMKAPLLPLSPEKKWSTPFLLQLGAPDFASPVAATITSSHPAGSTKSIQVDRAGLFQVGKYVELRGLITDPGKIKAAVAPYELEYAVQTKTFYWTDLTDGLRKIEKHRIVNIAGNTLTFAAPIAHQIDASDDWTISPIHPATEVGVEDLTIAGNWHEPFLHHRDALHDSGFSLLQIQNATDSWMRNVVMSDFCQAVNWLHTFHLTAENITLRGVQGHSAFGITYGNNNLTKNVLDLANSWHAPGFSKYSISNVHWRMSYDPTSTSDLHGQQSLHNLFDNTAGGWVKGRWGAAHHNHPNHLHGLIYWNHLNTGAAVEDFEFMNSSSKYGRLIMPHLIGLHGQPVSFRSQRFYAERASASGQANYSELLPERPQAHIEFNGQQVLPVSLYEAQLAYRKTLK